MPIARAQFSRIQGVENNLGRDDLVLESTTPIVHRLSLTLPLHEMHRDAEDRYFVEEAFGLAELSSNVGGVEGEDGDADDDVEVYVWNERLSTYVFVPEGGDAMGEGVDPRGWLSQDVEVDQAIGASSLESSPTSYGTPVDRVLPSERDILPFSFPLSPDFPILHSDNLPLCSSPDLRLPPLNELSLLLFAPDLPIIVEEDLSWRRYHGGFDEALSLSSVCISRLLLLRSLTPDR